MNNLGTLAQLSHFASNLTVDNIKAQAQSLQSRLSSLRPPQEFFNVKNISKPPNFSELQARVSYNLRYYSSNYGLIIGCLSIYTLLTNLLLLFVMIFVSLGYIGISKLQGQDLTTPFGVFKTSQLYTALLCIAVPLGFLASPISTLLWLIGASVITVFSHASFMEKPIETVFEEETV
ncbi:hypothetical protein KAFR_0H03430 [Kazachstania africana CBS 2517]|uniref:PRA1 family protein n=1 Tax=Kazachstania africana (strain ATCC 22294 / BCRC 22015 / CBS 2517 / CECT 1963 / NBRC 1671 / NRRL Y-8276) TaxID=1071382 RepID=H2AYH6_KAZAF|nr:hypothetical protein KAFR_0H03430 [Kazachstania africana CBS 2517]CCF59753.1 hypothetical protein KAFR_0H03430 [Kazachstania africana CBS 2517]